MALTSDSSSGAWPTPATTWWPPTFEDAGRSDAARRGLERRLRDLEQP
jgi:hypothetical protein